jgi:phosphoribosylamine--glycine ligase
MMAVEDGNLTEDMVKFSDKSACCVIVASKGYPVQYESGCPMTLPADDENGFIYVAGAKKTENGLVSAGGRVLGVVAVADTLEDAIKAAYKKTETVDFANGFYRHDIGAKALAALK